MADITVIIANPTSADVGPYGGVTATARTVTKGVLDDTSNDVYDFLTAGCSVAPYSPTAATMRRRQQGGYMLARLQGLYP
jgi:hypothetical protein